MPKDFRFALRGLGRSPAFAVVVVLTLALGVGATTAVFSVVNTVFLRALPFPEAERLVRIRNYSVAPDGARNRYGVTPRNYARLRDASQTLSGTVALLASNATRPSPLSTATTWLNDSTSATPSANSDSSSVIRFGGVSTTPESIMRADSSNGCSLMARVLPHQRQPP